MNKITSLLIIWISFMACQATEQVLDKTINYTYQNTLFAPEQIRQEIADGLFLKVTPIDASSLNPMTYEAAFRAGDYEREIAEEYLDVNLDNLDRRTREKIENQIKVSNTILRSVNNGILSPELGRNLFESIWDDIGFDGSETELYAGRRLRSNFNPYQIGSNYLSVFKLEFQNQTNHVITIKIDDFQISSGFEILTPLKMEYFEQRLSDSPLKIENAYRYNLNNELNIPPSNSVIKYLAVPAISMNVENVSIQYMGDTYTSFDFIMNLIREREEISLRQYLVHTSYPNVTRAYLMDLNEHIAIKLENGSSFPVKGFEFFISDDDVGTSVSLCIASISRYIGNLECREIALTDFRHLNFQIHVNN